MRILLIIYVLIWIVGFLQFSMQRSLLTVSRLSKIDYSILYSSMMPKFYNLGVYVRRFFKYLLLIYIFYLDWKTGLIILLVGTVISWFIPVPFFLFRNYFLKKSQNLIQYGLVDFTIICGNTIMSMRNWIN